MTSKERIGNFISLYELRNSEKKDYPVVGINKDKTFMPTVANLEGVDTAKYKVVSKGVFVFSGMQTGRDICIRIGLYSDDSPALVSPAYTTFTIDTKKVLPEYFFMFFNREESDRYGWFISDSSVRANLDWPRFLDIEIPLPSLSEQQKVVNAWKALREIKEQNEAKAAPLMQLCQSYIQELKHKYPAQEIGPYIEESNERNKNGYFGADALMGVCSEGTFIKSIANTSGLVFNNYKIVHRGDFAYSNRINVGSIALRYDDDCIISPSYAVFRIKNECRDKLLNEYLAIWFRRAEFLRATLFFAFGTIKDDFSHREMCRVKMPIPPLEVQRAIVNIYKCANEAKQIAAEADRLSREVCPALLQHVIKKSKQCLDN